MLVKLDGISMLSRDGQSLKFHVVVVTETSDIFNAIRAPEAAAFTLSVSFTKLILSKVIGSKVTE